MARAVKKSKIYKPKSLVDGARIGLVAGKQYVAISDKLAGQPITVIYGGAQMDIRDWKQEAQSFRRFRDKFWTADSNRPQYYTLGYFRFAPEIK